MWNILTCVETQHKLARIGSLALLQGFQNKLQSRNTFTNDNEVRATVIPPLPDLVELDDVSFSLAEYWDFGDLIYGNLSIL